MKVFEEGKEYVFSGERFKESEGKEDWLLGKKWIKKCEGKKVEVLNRRVGKVGVFNIHPEWCKEASRSHIVSKVINSIKRLNFMKAIDIILIISFVAFVASALFISAWL